MEAAKWSYAAFTNQAKAVLNYYPNKDVHKIIVQPVRVFHSKTVFLVLSSNSLLIGRLEETVSPKILLSVVQDFTKAFTARLGSHIHILDWVGWSAPKEIEDVW